jgi:hypothetical protein
VLLAVVVTLVGAGAQAAPAVAPSPPSLIVGCAVNNDPEARVYELRRDGDRWLMYMRSRKAGATAVVLPLPDAKPSLSERRVTLSYSTLNGGRAVEWRVTPSEVSLDVHANFELEVNVEADLDPRVELMNTDGVIRNLTCEIAPAKLW